MWCKGLIVLIFMLWNLVHVSGNPSIDSCASYQTLGKRLYEGRNYSESIKAFEKAIKLYEQSGVLNQNWIECYKSLLNAFWNINQMDLRKSYFQRITKFYENNKIAKEYINDYYLLKGDFFYSQSDYQEAIDSYMKVFQNIGLKTEKNNVVFEYILESYFNLKQYNKVVAWYEKLSPQKLNVYFKILIAYSYYETGDKGKAVYLMDKVKIVNPSNRYYSAILYRLPDFYFYIGLNDKAEYYYKIYLNNRLNNYGRVHYETSVAYSAIAYFYWYAKADYTKSLYYYHRNVYSLIQGKYCDDYYALPDVSKSISDIDLSKALNNKAEALYEVSKQRKSKAEKLRDLKASLANLELSLSVAHRYKMGFARDDKRYEYADYIKHRFPYIINICMELYRETGDKTYASKAFEYAEKSKSSLLLSTVRGVDANKMHLIPNNIKKREDQIWTATAVLSSTLSKEYEASKPNLDRIDQLNYTLYKLKYQQDSLVYLFKTKYPGYYNTRYNAEVIGSDSLQKLLNPDEAMLEYTLSNDKLVIFMLTHNEFKIFTDTIGNEFYADVATYRKTLEDFSFNYRNSTIRAFAQSSYNLYNHLIKPAEPFLKGKRLLIVPDDVLTQVPFETLITEPLLQTDRARYRALSYLLRKYVISYDYSGTLYARNCKALVYPNAKLLAVAPSYEYSQLSRLISKDLPSPQKDSIELIPIPGIYDEVKSINQLFGGKVLMKKWATEKKFKELAGNYEILHLATHGMVNNEYPMFSKLVFTFDNDSANDGLLNTYEIYNMQINAALVVLSACNSGYGKLHKGEGIISLSRGFFSAGAKSIVTTLWPIPDGTSSKLMNYFYTNLAAGQNIADALYHAKLDYLEQTDDLGFHPSLWAGYIALGNTSVILEPYKSKAKYYILTGMLILVVIGMILINNYRKNKLRPQ